MRKIIAIGGVPGTGKTTLFRKFMEGKTFEKVEPVKLMPALYSAELDLYILGKYDEGEIYAGTDKLSMACQPNIQEFAASTTSNILYEGDRIFNQSFLEFAMDLPDVDLQIIFLNASQPLLEQRYSDRGSNQSETFLKGRNTKYNNLLGNFDLMSYITEFPNTNMQEQAIILQFLHEKLSIGA